MSHIVSFSVSGLAGRKKPYSQVLKRDVNIFFGLNGAGKSTLLKILHSAMSNNPEILHNLPFNSAEVVIHSDDYQRDYTYSIEKKELKPSHTLPYDPWEERGRVPSVLFSRNNAKVQNYEWNITPKPPKEFTGTWRHRFLPTSRFYQIPRSFEPNRNLSEDQLEELMNGVFRDILNQKWARYNALISSEITRAQQECIINIVNATLAGFKATVKSKKDKKFLDSNSAYSRVVGFLGRQGTQGINIGEAEFIENYNKNNQLKEIVLDIEKVEQRISEISLPKNKFEQLIQHLFSENKEVRFLTSSIEIVTLSGRPLTLEFLSSGEKQLIGIFVEALSTQGGSFIIDEPELSMHIGWQRELINSVLNISPNTQIICATHSPEIMAEIPDDVIFSL